MTPTKFAIILTLCLFGIFYYSLVSVRLFAVQPTINADEVAATGDNDKTDNLAKTDKPTDFDSSTKMLCEPKPVNEREQKMTLILAGMSQKAGYSLKPEQVVKRVAPPFSKLRDQCYFAVSGAQGQIAPNVANAMSFFWDGQRLRFSGEIFGAVYTLEHVVDCALKIKSPNIEGPAEFLAKPLEGDWVVRPDAPQEQVLQELNEILQKQFKTPVQLAFAKRVRTVYLVRGKYRFRQTDWINAMVETDAGNSNDSGPIEIFGKVPGPKGIGGDGTGDLKEFLGVLGRWINATVIDDVEEPPAGEVSWLLNDGKLDRHSKSNHDPEYVLKNITAQTGLTFHKDYRVVRRLVVEPIE